jgi:pyruvate/2-oxoglutarate dehydrogenase complex dihydrolipoamide dehydrogenase (E3) component
VIGRGGRRQAYDVAVIGAGMGGWAGVRAARARGARVALFERGLVGGT